MRRRTRASLALATTAIVALGVAIPASGGPPPPPPDSANQESELSAWGTQNAQDETKRSGASLTVDVSMKDTDNSPVVPNSGWEEVYIDFDDDFLITTTGLAQCDPDALTGTTTQAAYDACPNALVGSGAAKARFAGFPFPNNEANITVTAFNGETSEAGGPCADTSLGGPPGCEFQGGNPVLLLHARTNAANNTSVVRGEIQDSPDTTDDYGHRLAVTDGTDVAGDAGAITLFTSTVKKRYTPTGGGNKRNYIGARCENDGASTTDQWDFRAEFIYDDDDDHGGTQESSDTDTFDMNCAQR